MIVAHQGHRGGEIECLPKTFQRAHGDEVPELAAPTGHNGDATPKQTAAQNQALAPNTVADKSGKRRAKGIDPHESRADQPELNVIETELILELRENGEDGL